MEKTKKKKPANIPLISQLVSESGIPVFRIEKEVGIGRSVLLRGLQENTKRPLPPRWELPLMKYLKKKIAEKQDVEIQTEEVLIEMGFAPPEKESNLKEEIKENKKTWLTKLQD